MIDITRTTPVVVTYGPAGLSGSVKMVGFVPRREYIGGLEMGFRHSWGNIRATHRAALVFYTPPATSFEVRCSVEVVDEDNDYKRYLNSIHDLFH